MQMRIPRPRTRLAAGVVAGLAVGVAGTMAAVAATSGPSAQPPPVASAKSAKSSQSKQVSRAGAVDVWGIASKNTALQAELVTITSLTVPPGTYQLAASGSLWSTGGSGIQKIGCHIATSASTYASAYASVQTGGVEQVPYAMVGLAIVKAQTTFQVNCLLGKNPVLGVSAYANLVATKLK